MYYYLIIALQCFCIYHLWKNRISYYWIFLIIFLPVIGCILYLYVHVFSKKDVERIQNELVTVINPTKKVRDLEQRLDFADTFQNRINLADSYLEIKDYINAIVHYEESLNDDFEDDYYVCEQLILSYYETEDYQKVISYSEKILDNSGFNGSRSQFLYGLALDKIGNTVEAESQLLKINQRYSFYDERVILAKFLMQHNNKNKAKEILDDVYEESLHMTSANRRIYRGTIAEVEKLLNEL